MEQATVAKPLGADRSTTGLPPGSRMPAALQALRYASDPLNFLVRLQRRRHPRPGRQPGGAPVGAQRLGDGGLLHCLSLIHI